MASKLPKSETGLESWGCDYILALGGDSMKLTFITGIPDRLHILPGGVALFFEYKTPIGEASSLQLWWVNHLRELGFTAEFIDSKPQIKNIIRKVLAHSETV